MRKAQYFAFSKENSKNTWIPACAHYCPERFPHLGAKPLQPMDLSIFLVRYRLKITVIPAIRELAPAKAGGGIQSFKARAPCGYWIPAFAGMTNIVGRDLFRTVVRLRGNDRFQRLCVSPIGN